MTALDTNVVVRFLTRDDESQYQKALELFRRETVHIPDTVWLEAEWVLRYAYNFDPAAVTKAFRDVLALPNVRVRDPAPLLLAIEWHGAGLDFADALHLASCQQLETLTTLDKAFASKSAGRGTCRVIDLLGSPA